MHKNWDKYLSPYGLFLVVVLHELIFLFCAACTIYLLIKGGALFCLIPSSVMLLCTLFLALFKTFIRLLRQ